VSRPANDVLAVRAGASGVHSWVIDLKNGSGSIQARARALTALRYETAALTHVRPGAQRGAGAADCTMALSDDDFVGMASGASACVWGLPLTTASRTVPGRQGERRDRVHGGQGQDQG
jgi:hypothetical protein